MVDDDFDVLEPDPLLSGSDGDEARELIGASAKDRRWLGVAAGIGVGSAAIVAALRFWGKGLPASSARQKRTS